MPAIRLVTVNQSVIRVGILWTKTWDIVGIFCGILFGNIVISRVGFLWDFGRGIFVWDFSAWDFMFGIFRGIFVWDFSVGIFVWDFCVGFLCGIFVWDFCVGFLCGIFHIVWDFYIFKVSMTSGKHQL